MAIGKASDFTIYDEQLYGGWHEELAQRVDIFNAASRNTIRLITEDRIGDYEKTSFFDRISGLVARRDTTSTSAVTDKALTQGELIGVKINRKIGPVAQALDAWEKAGKMGPEAQKEMSYQLGKQIAEEIAHDMVETSIRCLESALAGESANTYDGSAGTLTATKLNEGLALYGDQAQKIICWIMHSHCYSDLVGQAISDKIYEEAGMVVYGGAPGTLGRPVVVVDADALNVGAYSQTNTYLTLGLVENACIIKESESKRLVDEIVTGLEQLVFRIQGEYAYNVNLKGFAWDTTNGGANPTDASLRDTTNWDKQYSNAKNLPGVRIVTT